MSIGPDGVGNLVLIPSPGYALSKKEKRVGSPEKPLSGLGAVTYKRYWKISVFEVLRSAPLTVTMDGTSTASLVEICFFLTGG